MILVGGEGTRLRPLTASTPKPMLPLAGRPLLAFKPETDDMREASSLVLAARLLAEGAEVCAYDPVVDGARERLHGVSMCASAEEAMAGADAAVLVTEWASIVGLDWEALRPTMRSPIVIDGRNALDPAAMAAAGYHFEGIGRIPS